MNRQIKSAALGLPEKCFPPSGSFLKTSEKVWGLSYQFSSDFVAFQGHFSGNPILPALAQILMAKDSVATILEREVRVVAIKQAKFMSVVVPGDVVSVYAWPPEGGGLGEWRFHLTVTTAQKEGGDLSVADVSHLALKIDHIFPADSSGLAQESKVNYGL